MLCSAMDDGMVRTILKGAISSPAKVELPELDEAIQWVEGGGTILQLDRGTDPNVYSSQFEAAAVEMRVLRPLLAHREFISATESAQRMLKLLGHVRTTLRLDRASGGRKRAISATCRKTSCRILAVEFPSPCDGSELESGRSVFGGLVQVRTSSPSKECNLYRQTLPKGLGLSIGLESPRRGKTTPQRRNHCMCPLNLSILGKSLTP
jgi:hypothetical protein